MAAVFHRDKLAPHQSHASETTQCCVPTVAAPNPQQPVMMFLYAKVMNSSVLMDPVGHQSSFVQLILLVPTHIQSNVLTAHAELLQISASIRRFLHVGMVT